MGIIRETVRELTGSNDIEVIKIKNDGIITGKDSFPNEKRKAYEFFSKQSRNTDADTINHYTSLTSANIKIPDKIKKNVEDLIKEYRESKRYLSDKESADKKRKYEEERKKRFR